MIWCVLGLATPVVAAVLLPALVRLAVCSRRLAPLLAALAGGAASAFWLQRYAGTMPTPVRAVCLPTLVASLFAALTCRRADWESLGSGQHLWDLKPNRWRDAFIIVGGVLGTVLGASSFIGLPILRALGQDVVGIMPSEVREIRVAGGAFGGIAGSYAALLLWITSDLIVAQVRGGEGERGHFDSRSS